VTTDAGSPVLSEVYENGTRCDTFDLGHSWWIAYTTADGRVSDSIIPKSERDLAREVERDDSQTQSLR
jgi:hypothetical protein